MDNQIYDNPTQMVVFGNIWYLHVCANIHGNIWRWRADPSPLDATWRGGARMQRDLRLSVPFPLKEPMRRSWKTWEKQKLPNPMENWLGKWTVFLFLIIFQVHWVKDGQGKGSSRPFWTFIMIGRLSCVRSTPFLEAIVTKQLVSVLRESATPILVSKQSCGVNLTTTSSAAWQMVVCSQPTARESTDPASSGHWSFWRSEFWVDLQPKRCW